MWHFPKVFLLRIQLFCCRSTDCPDHDMSLVQFRANMIILQEQHRRKRELSIHSMMHPFRNTPQHGRSHSDVTRLEWDSSPDSQPLACCLH
ncbi:uncharacterized protein BO72DRAFT_72505 [Aspergillus fijiensis CBS 313.89]|uniref:Secreted protein n=1 Tax=Aspergillus fijiensis CBS 313.89 TaxID=1448319 RepID=A0A8G1RQH5_9EURO|nr:uncharacterized protein BO72DRAFT_72505 [Aspergillus fijiensis CBS 313.89]RAK78382.1 hypothetical protein BO72DRAFT_72505 [Aspergillus fijiensis CBS 313.89]